jgi:hypothetical protein
VIYALCKRTKRFIQNQNKDGFQPHQTPACLLRQRGRSGDSGLSADPWHSGNTGAMFLMLGIMLPAFLLAMYEKDGLPFEKVVRNIIRAKFLRPGIRAYRTENIYAPFAGPGAGKEDVIEKHKEEKRSRRQG